MEEIINLDKELFLFFNNLGSTTWDGFWSLITLSTTWIPFYLLLLFLIYKNYGPRHTALIIGILLLLILTNDQITNLIKYNIQRPRPCITDDLVGLFRRVACEGRGPNSFPSAHASNHFAIAVFVGLVLKSKSSVFFYFLLFWAAVIAYSRIYLGVHFPIDIIFGTAMGSLLGWIFFKILNYLKKKILSE